MGIEKKTKIKTKKTLKSDKVRVFNPVTGSYYVLRKATATTQRNTEALFKNVQKKTF